MGVKDLMAQLRKHWPQIIHEGLRPPSIHVEIPDWMTFLRAVTANFSERAEHRRESQLLLHSSSDSSAENAPPANEPDEESSKKLKEHSYKPYRVPRTDREERMDDKERKQMDEVVDKDYREEKHAAAKITGLELYRSLTAELKRFLQGDCAFISIIMADKPSWKPLRKQRLALMRTEAWLNGKDMDGKPNEPYAPNSIICDDGVLIGTRTEPIDTGRLFFTKGMRAKVLEYVWDKLSTDASLPINTRVIYDVHDQDAPRFLTVQVDEAGGRSNMVQVMTNYVHRYGEADLAFIYWTQKAIEMLRDAQIPKPWRLLLVSVDGDTLPLLLYHFWDLEDGVELYWMANRANLVWIDVTAFITLLKGEGWKAGQFVSMCMLYGVDYFVKKLATDQIGHDHITDAFIRYHEWMPQDGFHTVEALANFVRCIACHLYDKSPKELRDLTAVRQYYEFIKEHAEKLKKEKRKLTEDRIGRLNKLRFVPPSSLDDYYKVVQLEHKTKESRGRDEVAKDLARENARVPADEWLWQAEYWLRLVDRDRAPEVEEV